MSLSSKKMIAIYLAVIFFVSLDRFLKLFSLLNQGQEYSLIGDFLKLSFKANYYVAFSLPLAGKFLIAVISLIIISLVFLAIHYLKQKQNVQAGLLFMIIFGAASNLFDRLKYGYVVDYLDLKYFTIFNLADAMIVAGAVMILIYVRKS